MCQTTIKTQTHKKTPVKEGPITRSRTKELEKQNQPKKLYSEVLKNNVQNICAQQNSVHNKNEAQKFGALKIGCKIITEVHKKWVLK